MERMGWIRLWAAQGDTALIQIKREIPSDLVSSSRLGPTRIFSVPHRRRPLSISVRRLSSSTHLHSTCHLHPPTQNSPCWTARGPLGAPETRLGSTSSATMGRPRSRRVGNVSYRPPHPSFLRSLNLTYLVGQACATCTSRKVKCSGAKPACHACFRTARREDRDPFAVVCQYKNVHPTHTEVVLEDSLTCLEKRMSESLRSFSSRPRGGSWRQPLCVELGGKLTRLPRQRDARRLCERISAPSSLGVT